MENCSKRKGASPEKNRESAKILSEMINCKTVFTENSENKAEFEKFYSVIEKNFPNIVAKAKKLVFGSGCFFYVIEGKNPEKNILLMSHHDVVDSGEGWDSDAFSATEKDGFLFGRGTIDTKTPLFAELMAAEELLSEGYEFEGFNLYIGSSNNEECSGDGMVLAAEYFKKEGIFFETVLDEGGAITEGMIPGVKCKSAVV
ncbi:MAG: M20/M25/M40 family metallo-hydrolase, partial [Oscillospiraceae bacterium]|nr:M20/M25/M40 family metallo-hydrolase [Oscillospiraceae bacterium]